MIKTYHLSFTLQSSSLNHKPLSPSLPLTNAMMMIPAIDGPKLPKPHNGFFIVM